MSVGAAEDVAKQLDYAYAKTQMDMAKLAGLDTIRVTQTWTRGQKAVGPMDTIMLGNVVEAAQFTGVRVIVSLYPFGSSVTPLTDDERANFAAFCVDAAKKFPYVKDFIVGNEPNLNRFWMPQFGPAAEDVAAPAYVSLLATAYDALKAERPRSTIYGGALAPRGVDKPGTGRDTHSPSTFILDMGSAYRDSGRLIPIMDAFAFHPYGENSTIPPDVAHPLGSSIGLADYGKLVGLLGQAFDGTAQRGSTLPIVYDEYGVETTLARSKAPLYVGNEPATINRLLSVVRNLLRIARDEWQWRSVSRTCSGCSCSTFRTSPRSLRGNRACTTSTGRRSRALRPCARALPASAAGSPRGATACS